MNAEIIAIGSELLLGQIANTNAQYISKKLAELGVNVYYHQVVGDNKDRLKNLVESAKNRSDLIIFTGGLGPTKDDLTKETIASCLNKKLVLDHRALELIKDYFVKVNRDMTENNKKQALVIEGSHVLANDFGMAPGMAIKVDKKTFMLFPGPPKELYPMFDNYAVPYIKQHIGESNVIHSKVLRFFGIGEAQLETELEDLLEEQTNPTIAPLAGEGEVTLRLTAKHDTIHGAAELIDRLEQKVRKKVGQYIYGIDDTSLPQEVIKKLTATQYTLAAAESLTGGLFSKEMTEFPGASSFYSGGIVSYTNEMKTNVLNISQDLLQKYGAVSEQCAIKMAEEVRLLCNADIGISFTGVAGPEPLESKAVGTVFIAIAMKNKKTEVFSINLAGSREAIRVRTIKYGYYYLLKQLQL
ncbi:competence/damage-inducible protein A [Lottiidibacillus patelloidae]|uniref:Putative competence-damage inducible protein n=1 Tax=Lottiidibacillus patelloidae TaxID=2670334 RepID=A0A263BY41_9BACI|nr:competence/damage-inducible protein A [Lottiidibacillus patelloidae]OZM58639.1 competence/damage-inducible protein A [Lottiidibacillus patelloidae]